MSGVLVVARPRSATSSTRSRSRRRRPRAARDRRSTGSSRRRSPRFPRCAPDVRRVIPVALRRWRRALLVARDVARDARVPPRAAPRALRRGARHAGADQERADRARSRAARATASTARAPASRSRRWFDDVHHRGVARRCTSSSATGSSPAPRSVTRLDGPPRWRWTLPRAAGAACRDGRTSCCCTRRARATSSGPRSAGAR